MRSSTARKLGRAYWRQVIATWNDGGASTLASGRRSRDRLFPLNNNAGKNTNKINDLRRLIVSV
jgi:hypothetical protein